MVHAVFGREAEDVVNGAAPIGRGTMLADMLDAPIAELAMSNDIDTSKNLVDARTLPSVSNDHVK